MWLEQTRRWRKNNWWSRIAETVLVEGEVELYMKVKGKKNYNCNQDFSRSQTRVPLLGKRV